MTNPPPNRWDERYDRERYFYGEEPNAFLAAHLPGLPPGNALFLAEGEGRNAVYAALLGHQVLADDWSTDPWSGKPWDAVVLCFAHLPPDDAVAMHARVAACLAPGGHLLLNSFSKAQLGRTSGGPPQLDWLHDLTELKGQFPGVVFDHAVEREVELGEGVGHRGKAMVIEMVGRKG